MGSRPLHWVLLVDDDQDTTELHAEVLRQAGFLVDHTGDPSAALAAIVNHGKGYDAVVTDYSFDRYASVDNFYATLTGIQLIDQAMNQMPDGKGTPKWLLLTGADIHGFLEGPIRRVTDTDPFHEEKRVMRRWGVRLLKKPLMGNKLIEQVALAVGKHDLPGYRRRRRKPRDGRHRR